MKGLGKFCSHKCMYKRNDPAKRFWSLVKKTKRCWWWKGNVSSAGYGRFWVERESILAHRYSWMLKNEKIPKGIFALHRCDNTLCVKPSHLFLGTQTDNMVDMAKKGRSGHSKKTHCPRNHPYAGDNLIVKHNRRWCRACARKASLDYYYRVRKPRQMAKDTLEMIGS